MKFGSCCRARSRISQAKFDVAVPVSCFSNLALSAALGSFMFCLCTLRPRSVERNEEIEDKKQALKLRLIKSASLTFRDVDLRSCCSHQLLNHKRWKLKFRHHSQRLFQVLSHTPTHTLSHAVIQSSFPRKSIRIARPHRTAATKA